jgi:hypothetical protein
MILAPKFTTHAASKDAQKSEPAQLPNGITPEIFGTTYLDTNVDILKLSNAHISDQVIIAEIQSHAGSFDTDAGDLITMSKAGVSDKVLMALIKNRQGALTPSPDK